VTRCGSTVTAASRCSASAASAISAARTRPSWGALVVAGRSAGKEAALREGRGAAPDRARGSSCARRAPPRAGGDAVGDADPLSLRHDTVKSSRASGPAAVAPPAEPEGNDAATARIQRPAEPAPPPARLPPREAQSERTQDISQLPKQKIRRATLPFQDDEASPGSAGPAGAPAPRRPALPFSPGAPAQARHGPSACADRSCTGRSCAGRSAARGLALVALRRGEHHASRAPRRRGSRRRHRRARAPARRRHRRRSSAPPRVAIDALPSPPKVVLQAPPPPAVPAIPTMLSEGALAEAARASSAVLEARASKVEVVVPPAPCRAASRARAAGARGHERRGLRRDRSRARAEGHRSRRRAAPPQAHHRHLGRDRSRASAAR
jgi:hypothetical protein